MECNKTTTATIEKSSYQDQATGFFCTGRIVLGGFVPEQVRLIGDSSEAEERVRAYLRERGLA